MEPLALPGLVFRRVLALAVPLLVQAGDSIQKGLLNCGILSAFLAEFVDQFRNHLQGGIACFVSLSDVFVNPLALRRQLLLSLLTSFICLLNGFIHPLALFSNLFGQMLLGRLTSLAFLVNHSAHHVSIIPSFERAYGQSGASELQKNFHGDVTGNNAGIA